MRESSLSVMTALKLYSTLNQQTTNHVHAVFGGMNHVQELLI